MAVGFLGNGDCWISGPGAGGSWSENTTYRVTIGNTDWAGGSADAEIYDVDNGTTAYSSTNATLYESDMDRIQLRNETGGSNTTVTNYWDNIDADPL
jgi:hypothetical protein